MSASCRLHSILCSYSIDVASCCNSFHRSIDNYHRSGCIHAPAEAQDWWPGWCCPCPRLLWYLGCSGMFIVRLGQWIRPSVLVLYFFSVRVFFLQLVAGVVPIGWVGWSRTIPYVSQCLSSRSWLSTGLLPWLEWLGMHAGFHDRCNLQERYRRHSRWSAVHPDPHGDFVVWLPL